MATVGQFEKITAEVNAYLKDQDEPAHKPMTVSEVAMGFIEVANEAMCRPIRALTQVGESAITTGWRLGGGGGGGGGDMKRMIV